MAGGTLRFVLGDQLSHHLSSLGDIDPARDTIWMCEVWEEATYVRHHKKKIAFIFSAMRHFAAALTGKGYAVHYTKLDDTHNAGSFRGEIARAIKQLKPQKIIVTAPAEYRVLQDMQKWQKDFSVPVEIRADDRFYATADEFAAWAKERKQLRMEYFYREMRKKHGILLAPDGTPEGGQWNYDSENRKPPEGGLFMSQPLFFDPDEVTREVLALVENRFPDHFGDLAPFHLAVTAQDAEKALIHFIEERLPYFGDYQDAMLQGQPFMYHSYISFYLNCGLLDPRQAVARAEAAYRAGRAPLNAVEGFIRQIIGWREYVRGIYWLKMPGYADENALAATRKLPWFYWTGETDMNCLRQCIDETKKHAYAHHIQRLMVLGNFALLAGIHPDEVNEWYLIVYADAYEWVELPNVTGMVLYADGGLLASKPYAASGSYINRMSDYCKGCRFNVNKKSGADACPFNYLYWDFLLRNKDKLKNNPRLAMIYRTAEKMSAEQLSDMRKSAASFLEEL
jgi:deoxyribodipyrimidine photolyase-related protein